MDVDAHGRNKIQMLPYAIRIQASHSGRLLYTLVKQDLIDDAFEILLPSAAGKRWRAESYGILRQFG